ncbi:hypothetical protein K0T92_02795 [Paenibacillus oenotherae]|uniref:Uncharacterized protein n=1 Tax=Paenibacillus oenotherae TaxID=1435645 RepID=A0ABS7D197_9BACL|nr:hypothetical protein [Paenibacillus oenotherae]MBW7473670.1 hypothetical protein [Paenibacillus oenotherae]
MQMQPLHSIELHLPEDKLPGYYAQIIKGIADTVTIVDRDKTVLFVQSAADADAVEAFVQRYRVDCERALWIALEDSSWELNDRLFTDYGLHTRLGNHYLDLGLVALVALSASGAHSELESALLQTEEHAIARAQENGQQLIAIDRHQIELIEGIARAYQCKWAQLL